MRGGAFIGSNKPPPPPVGLDGEFERSGGREGDEGPRPLGGPEGKFELPSDWYWSFSHKLSRFAVNRGVPQDRAEGFPSYVVTEARRRFDPAAVKQHSASVLKAFEVFCWRLARWRVNNPEWYPNPQERSLDAMVAPESEDGKEFDPESSAPGPAETMQRQLDYDEALEDIRRLQSSLPEMEAAVVQLALDAWLRNEEISKRSIGRDLNKLGFRNKKGDPYSPQNACMIVAKVFRLLGETERR